jgi:FkbM family methyltransferase
MERMLARTVTRRKPFRVESVPLINRIYKYPFEKWSSPGKQTLFGVANIGLFYAYQRLVPIPARGRFRFKDRGVEKVVGFDGRNTQYASLYFSWYEYGYEPEVTALLDVLISDDGVFYDVGSNWGYLSLFVASRPGFHGEIHAFEPFPPTFANLSDIVSQAGVADRVTLHNQAVGEQPGRSTMRIPGLLHSGWATVEETKETSASQANTVEIITLDSLKLKPPSVVKIDAERSEAKVLKGGLRLIKEHHPMIVFESLKALQDPKATLEPFWILQDAGYRFYRPCWLRNEESRAYFLGGDSHAAPVPNEVLALVPLDPARRLLAYDQLNVFACHERDLGHLASLFPGV